MWRLGAAADLATPYSGPMTATPSSKSSRSSESCPRPASEEVRAHPKQLNSFGFKRLAGHASEARACWRARARRHEEVVGSI